MSRIKIILLATSGSQRFLNFTIASITNCGIQPEDICVYTPREQFINNGCVFIDIETLDSQKFRSPSINKYAEYGSEEFSINTLLKWVVIEHAFRQSKDHIVFSDIDVFWMKNPLDYLSKALDEFEIAIQSEGMATIPPTFCTGFMAMKNSEYSRKLIEALQITQSKSIKDGVFLNDQDVFNFITQNKLIGLQKIHTLPESLFPVGKLSNLLLENKFEEVEYTGSCKPFIMHANWVLGEESKFKLMQFSKSCLERSHFNKQDFLSWNQFNDTQLSACVFETCPSTPHLETGLEIYYNFRLMSSDTKYAPMFKLLPKWESFIFESLETHQKILQKLEQNLIKLPNLNCVQLPTITENSVSDYPKFTTLKELFHLKFDSFPIGKYIVSSATFMLKKVHINFENELDVLICKILYRIGIISYIAADKLLENGRYNLAIIFNGRFVTTAGIKYACLKNKIKFALHERAPDLDCYILETDTLHSEELFHERIIKHSELSGPLSASLNASKFFNTCEERLERSWPSFAKHQKVGSLPKLLKAKGFFTFFVSCPDEFVWNSESYNDFSPFGDQQNAFELLENLTNSMGIHLVVRVHPNMKTKNDEERLYWDNIKRENVTVIKSGSSYDTYEIMRHSECVITYSSSIGIESLYNFIPTISLSKSLYGYADELMSPNNIDQLKLFLENPKIPKTRNGAIKYGNYMYNHGIKFHYFKASSRTTGKFMDIDLMH